MMQILFCLLFRCQRGEGAAEDQIYCVTMWNIMLHFPRTIGRSFCPFQPLRFQRISDLCRVMCIGKEGTPGGCKSQVPHLIDILLTMFYFNADHLNILCLLTSICFQLGEYDLACCTL